MRLFVRYPQIAAMTGVLVKSVHRWAQRYPSFPAAKTCPTCGYRPVFDREQVAGWLADTDRRLRQ